MTRIRLLLGSLALLLVAGVALLVLRALDSIEEEEQLRHEVVASRVFDELERELTSLLEREEERSFLEYRTLYVPEGQLPGNATLSVSPLAEGPTDPYVVGWYQIEPDGELNLPWNPTEVEELAVASSGYQLKKDASDLGDAEVTIATVTEPLRGSVEDEWAARVEDDDADGKAAEAEQARRQRLLDEAWQADEERRRTEAEERRREEEAALAEREAAAVPAQEAAVAGAVPGDDDEEAPAGAAKERRKDDAAAAPEPTPEAAPEAEKQAEEEAEDDADYDEIQVEADSRPAPVATTSSSPARRSGGRASAGGKLKRPTKKQQSDREVLESLNRGSTSRSRRQTKSEAYNVDNTDVFQQQAEPAAGEAGAGADAEAGDANARNEELALAEPEVPFEPTPAQTTEELLRDLSVETEGDLGGGLAGGEAGPALVAGVETSGARSSEAATAPASATVSAAEPVTLPPAKTKPKSTTQAETRAIPRPKKEAPPPAAPEVTEVLVTVDPFTGYRPDAHHLVLHRDVRVGKDRYVQGLVVQLPALVEALQGTVVGVDLEDALQLRWPDIGVTTGATSIEPTHTFEHTFADPFDSLTAVASMALLPRSGGGGDPRRWVLWLALLLGVVGVAGFGVLERSVAVVVQFAERRANFVSAVTHELKTPLTAIRMYGEILRDGMVADEAKKQEYYGTITTESDRLGRLINNVLELSALEKGTRTMRVEVGELGPVLDEVVQILGPHARDRGLELITEVADDAGPVRFDRDALLQVVINLVDNAIKFSAGNGGDRIVLRADAGGLSIRDHGPGIPPRQLKRVFQPFFRGERELTRNTKGTGIGLSLVQGLVEEMGGRVSANNHPQGGLVVRISFANS